MPGGNRDGEDRTAGLPDASVIRPPRKIVRVPFSPGRGPGQRQAPAEAVLPTEHATGLLAGPGAELQNVRWGGGDRSDGGLRQAPDWTLTQPPGEEGQDAPAPGRPHGGAGSNFDRAWDKLSADSPALKKALAEARKLLSGAERLPLAFPAGPATDLPPSELAVRRVAMFLYQGDEQGAEDLAGELAPGSPPPRLPGGAPRRRPPGQAPDRLGESSGQGARAEEAARNAARLERLRRLAAARGGPPPGRRSHRGSLSRASRNRIGFRIGW